MGDELHDDKRQGTASEQEVVEGHNDADGVSMAADPSAEAAGEQQGQNPTEQLHDDKQQATSSEQEVVQPTQMAKNEDEGEQRAIDTANEAAMEQLDDGDDPPVTADPEETLDPVLAGKRIPVSTTEIDRELMQIWKATTARQQEEDRSTVSLLRAMNLIVYVESDERAKEIDEAIGQVTGRHPCRTILIVQRPAEDGTEDEKIEAWISAHCQLPQNSDRYICSEQVTIAASGDAIERVPNMALNLLVTDLPVFLWWDTGTPFGGYVRDHLMQSIDRLIVDSALWEDPIGGLLALAERAPQRKRDRYAATDFNWGRLSIWRESTAQFFDAHMQRPFLNRLALVQVEYVDPGGGKVANPVQALLYVGWLAGRLGWTLQKGPADGGYTRGRDILFSFRQGQRPVQVVLRAVPANDEVADGIVVIRLATGGPDRATYEIRLHSDTCSTVVVDTKTGEPVRRTRGFIPTTDASLLDQELEIFGRDRVYEQAFEVATQMVAGNPAMRDLAAFEAEQEGTSRRAAFDPRF